MHVGVKASVAKAKGEAITAWSALSGQQVVSHTEAVLGMLQMSWLRVHLYAALLEEQVEAAQADPGSDQESFDKDLVDGQEDAGGRRGGRGAASVGPGAGLVGHTFSGVKDLGIFATGEAIRGLAQLEATERDRCVKFAKTAHDMGIAEAQVNLVREQAGLVAGLIGRILDSLELSPDQQKIVPGVVQRELRAVAGGEAA
jgi:hypothetical protein